MGSEFAARVPKRGAGAELQSIGTPPATCGVKCSHGFLWDSVFCVFTAASKVLFFLFPIFFSSPIFKSLDCLCGFCNISVCPPVAVHPLLRHLVADEVISGHEMLCVSDNVFE